MMVSSRGRYAIRLMLDLALNQEKGVVTIREIARRQEISEKYLEQIVSMLKKAGYVRSVRGAQGGYCLAKKPEEYTAGMILRLTEGNMAPVSCMEDESNACKRADSCVTLKLWTMVDEAVRGVIDRVTIADMAKWQNEECSGKSCTACNPDSCLFPSLLNRRKTVG